MVKNEKIESEFEILLEEGEKEDQYDINEDFRLDPRKFLGHFRNKKHNYKVLKKYIIGKGE